MAFPTDLEIEVAFNNDIDETDYAQTGWTSILPFVAAFTGDLRGREYELDRAEAGTITVTLDNSDGRFIPGSVNSPYFPNVKSDRRFRIRGKNMVHPNVARGGGRDRDLTGFLKAPPGLTAPAWYIPTVAAFTDPRTITASAEPNSGIGQGKEKVDDGHGTTMWTINTQAGWIQYQYPVAVRMQKYKLQVPAGNTTRNPVTWTLQGSNNGSTFTTIHTVTGNVWTDDYEIQEFTVTSPNFYLYYRLDITANAGAVANTQLAEWSLSVNDIGDDILGNDDLSHYAEINVNASQPINTTYETLGWFVPLEYGTRLSHSAMIWRISGTEPTGMTYKLHITYYDTNLAVVATTTTDPRWDVTTLPTTQTPTQIGFSHTPPPEAKYGVVSLAVSIGGTTNSTALVYGITGIQSELPTNLAPDISGYRDTFNWQMQGIGTFASVGSGTSTGSITEATSPSYVSGNTATVTTASFTPANNSLLVAMCAFGNGTGGTAALGTVTDSLGGTWTRKSSSFATNRGVSEIWMRDVVTGAAMTVSYARGGTATASGVSLKVQVLTGAKAVSLQTGAVATIDGTSAFTRSITTTFANSRVYGSFARAATAVSLAANSYTTIYGQIAGSSGDVGAAFRATNQVTIAGLITLGFNNTDTSGNQGVLMEVLAASVNVSDPATSYLAVTWDVNDSNLFITIPHLIPGEWYTATIEAQKVGTQPDLLFSGNEGLTGSLINTTSMTQYTTTFLAEQPEQEIRFILQGTPTAAEGLRLRKLKVQLGQGLTLTLPTTAIDSEFSTWLRPKDIFEGWVESWPVHGGQIEMSITVVDRMKRLGDVELANTLREALLQDRPMLLMPLTDSMLDTPGRFSQLGAWADQPGGPSFVDIGKKRGDLGTSTYTTLTDDGPTKEASLKLNPQTIGAASVGYFLVIPYTKDYATPTPTPAPPPAPKPPAPTTYVYTKKWYATWSRTYEGDNSTRFDDSAYMYQGAYTGSPGNQKSLAGFDYKNIMSTLSGATILEAYITVENEHARWNNGLYVFVGTHNYSSKPSTWADGSVRQNRWKKWVGENQAVTVNVGVTVGNEFKSGSTRGIGIGPEPTNDSDNYGYFRGATQSGKPYITIKYRK